MWYFAYGSNLNSRAVAEWCRHYGYRPPALRLGKPPQGFGKWTLQLLADQLVRLEVVDSICPETVRKTLKKTA